MSFFQKIDGHFRLFVESPALTPKQRNSIIGSQMDISLTVTRASVPLPRTEPYDFRSLRGPSATQVNAFSAYSDSEDGYNVLS
jgi:hypothetical protein